MRGHARGSGVDASVRVRTSRPRTNMESIMHALSPGISTDRMEEWEKTAENTIVPRMGEEKVRRREP